MTNKLEPFKLEEYLATREFSSKYMFCASDVESRSIGEVLDLVPSHEKEAFLALSLGYTLPEGHPDLRNEISKLYSGLGPDQVLCFAGAEEAIYSAATVFLGQDDHAIAITPCYQSLESVATSICDVSKVDLELVDGAWHLEVDRIAAEIKPNTKMIFVNFPHNPTGFIPSQTTFQAIIDLAEKHGLILFSDEVYRGLELRPGTRLPSASELSPNAISLGVMSKSFGFAGLRIGWITCQNQGLLERLSHFKHYLSICNSAPSEWLATAILRHKEIVLAQNIDLVRRQYTQVREYFQSQPDLFQWVEPQGGCTAYPKYLGNGSVFAVADHLRESKGVVILPDWVYGQDTQHFRVAFGRQNCAEALQHFADFFTENQHYENHSS